MGRKIEHSISDERPCELAPPVITPEAREARMIALAYDVSEMRLRQNTASSAEVCHWLKMGSIRNQIELENLRMQNNLAEAKIKQIEDQAHMEEIYANAIEAMKSYQSSANAVNDDDFDPGFDSDMYGEDMDNGPSY